MNDCKHWQGDMVNGCWVCAKCYKKRPHQPYRLLKPTKLRGEDGQPYIQDVLKAPVAKAQGYTLGEFIEAMALRLIARTRGGFQKPDAMDYAIDILRSIGERFGSGDMDWTRDGAWELVDEDMQHWDTDNAATN
nr:hypothetical protein [uncultured Roseovarius sp.]